MLLAVKTLQNQQNLFRKCMSRANVLGVGPYCVRKFRRNTVSHRTVQYGSGDTRARVVLVILHPQIEYLLACRLL